MVTFNCPQWGISLYGVTFQAKPPVLRLQNITSCDSLVRVCFTVPKNTTSQNLYFFPYVGSNWAHLAELTFYNDSSPCPEDTILQPETDTINGQDTTSSNEVNSPSDIPQDITSSSKNTSGEGSSTAAKVLWLLCWFCWCVCWLLSSSCGGIASTRALTHHLPPCTRKLDRSAIPQLNTRTKHVTLLAKTMRK